MHHLLGLGDNGVQVRLVLKTLCVDLVDVLRTGRPGCEPAASGHDFETADGGVVPRGAGQPGGDWLASQGRRLEGLRRQLLTPRLLFDSVLPTAACAGQWERCVSR